jgi:hypothetical protein
LEQLTLELVDLDLTICFDHGASEREGKSKYDDDGRFA